MGQSYLGMGDPYLFASVAAVAIGRQRGPDSCHSAANCPVRLMDYCTFPPWCAQLGRWLLLVEVSGETRTYA